MPLNQIRFVKVGFRENLSAMECNIFPWAVHNYATESNSFC